MQVYWRERKGGQRLVLADEFGSETEVGGVRIGTRSIDAFAKSPGYSPGRAERGFASLDDGKAFVASFRPWELYAEGQGLEVENEVRPPLATTNKDSTASGQQTTNSAPEMHTDEKTQVPAPRRGWRFWQSS